MTDDRRPIAIDERIQSWIALGADPAGARWHGALAATLDHLAPYLVRGRLVTAAELGRADAECFARLTEALDLPPGCKGVFLPPPLAGALSPPPRGEALRRAPAGVSRLVLLVHRRQPQRLVVGEAAAVASSGVDLFEKGCRVVARDAADGGSLAAGLSELAWRHLDPGGGGSRAERERYTEWWLVRCVAAGRTDLPLHAELSYIHRPREAGLTPVAAVFKLAAAVLPEVLDPAARGAGEDPEALAADIESRLVALLDLLRRGGVVDFAAVTGDEAETFKAAFARTVRRVCARLEG